MQVNQELIESLHNSNFKETACSSDTASLYSIDTCLWAGKTNYCDVVIAKSPIFGKMLFIDNEMQSAESDEAIYHEFLVHPILNACTNMREKRVLIVGGGEGATLREVLKWDTNQVKEIVWVDIDSDLVDLSRRHLCYADDNVYNDKRCTFYADDIRSYLAENTTPFDIIILDLPDPDIEYLEEYPSTDEEEYELYSPVFWKVLKQNLTANGQIVSHTGPVAPGRDTKKWRGGLDWINKHADMPNACAYHVNIPSFQSEWGFWMSKQPSHMNQFPDGLQVMDSFSQIQAFGWPAYWTRLATNPPTRA